MAVGKWDRPIQGERAYGEAGTSVPRERVWSKPPSRLEEDEGPGQGQRYEIPRRILHTGSRDSGGRRESRHET